MSSSPSPSIDLIFLSMREACSNILSIMTRFEKSLVYFNRYRRNTIYLTKILFIHIFKSIKLEHASITDQKIGPFAWVVREIFRFSEQNWFLYRYVNYIFFYFLKTNIFFVKINSDTNEWLLKACHYRWNIFEHASLIAKKISSFVWALIEIFNFLLW